MIAATLFWGFIVWLGIAHLVYGETELGIGILVACGSTLAAYVLGYWRGEQDSDKEWLAAHQRHQTNNIIEFPQPPAAA